MKNVNEIKPLAKGIMYNRKTDLCIFEINKGKIEWYNVHIDNIEGKFYKGCSARLYEYEDGLIKAVIENPDKKNK